MVEISQILSFDNLAFKVYLICSAILVLKTLLMAPLTARHRFGKRIFISAEDAVLRRSKVKHDDPDIERVRRAHRNDLENLLIFFVASFYYLMTGPKMWLAVALIVAFTIARIIHTFVYAISPKQPHRALAFFVGWIITSFMTLSTIVHFY